MMMEPGFLNARQTDEPCSRPRNARRRILSRDRDGLRLDPLQKVYGRCPRPHPLPTSE